MKPARIWESSWNNLGRYQLVLGFRCAAILLRLLRVREIKGGPETMRELLCIIVCPKVHEVEMGLVTKHVIVHRRHLNAVVTQSAKHRIDLGCKQHEITRNRGLALPCGLKIDGCPVPIAGGISMPPSTIFSLRGTLNWRIPPLTLPV